MASELAERLAACRKVAGLSQTDVAAALKVSRQSVSKWERGDTTPSEELVAALASLYGVAPESLRGDLPAEPEAVDAPADESATAPENAQDGESDTALSPEKAQDGESDSIPSPEKAQEDSNSTPSSEKAQEDSDPIPSPEKAQDGDSNPIPSPEKTQEEDSDPIPSPEKTPLTKKKTKKEPGRRKLRLVSEHKNLRTAKEKKEPRHPSAPPFRTVADVGPNEMAYVYIDKNDGKWRTLLPFFAALPLCAGVFALVIRHKFKQ